MSPWEHAKLGGETCGHCGARIPEASPLLARYVADATIRKVRCPACARVPVNQAELDAAPARPPDPPPQDWDLTMRRRRPVERVSPLRPPVPLADIAKDLPFDGRMAAAGKDDDWLGSRAWTPGEREPGCDDE